MHRLLIISTFLLVHMHSMHAQEEISQEARTLIENLSKQLDAYSSLQAEFDMEINVPGESKQLDSGHLIQEKEKFVFDLHDQTIYSDGTAVWVHLKNENEVQINDPDFGEDGTLMSPSQVMRIYESEDFFYDIVHEEGIMSHVEFKPSDELSDFSKLRIVIDTEKTQMRTIEMFYKDGTKIKLNIHRFVFDIPHAKETFVFNAEDYPKIYVEDLRID